MTSVTRIYRFSASHRLHLKELSEEENRALYGKCNNPYGHGHDYVMEVTAHGQVDPRTGLVLPLGDLDRLLEEQVLKRCHNRNINLDLPEFADLVPTTENILLVVTNLIQQNWDRYITAGATLVRVHIQETARNGFDLRVRAKAPSSPIYNERKTVLVNG